MSENALKLSILDQSFVSKGMTAREALNNTVAVAELADRLGYHRFWVSEHHNAQQIAGSAPEIMMVKLADQTQRIRVGSGGVMLPNHSALKVAENFRTLEALFPGRIDLGLGRSSGSDGITHQLLKTTGQSGEQGYIEQLDQLKMFFNDEASTQYGPIIATPKIDEVPQQWLLSTSGGSSQLAAERGLGLAVAKFIRGGVKPEIVETYYQHFVPSVLFPKPKALVCVTLLCAQTDIEVEKLLKQNDFFFIQLQKGIFEPPPCYEEIKDYRFSAHEQQLCEKSRRSMVYGTPDIVKQQIEDIAQRYQVDEIMLTTMNTEPAHRLVEFQLLADEFGLANNN